mmetsp:Transcript_20015/g.60490  ORF Transcript_20015/g.60490 Transcript_20015/m.60490 type:complete len:92 (+) Transcript_20015:379-654(+)
MCFLCTDPFAEAGDNEDSGKDYVHIRVQQRNGKKSLTTIQGLEKNFDYKKVLKAFKKGELSRRSTFVSWLWLAPRGLWAFQQHTLIVSCPA